MLPDRDLWRFRITTRWRSPGNWGLMPRVRRLRRDDPPRTSSSGLRSRARFGASGAYEARLHTSQRAFDMMPPVGPDNDPGYQARGTGCHMFSAEAAGLARADWGRKEGIQPLLPLLVDDCHEVTLHQRLAL